MCANTLSLRPCPQTLQQLSDDDGPKTVLATRLALCNSFGTRLRGLMFHRRIAPDQAFLFDLGRSSRWRAAMHTWFVFFPIAIIWLDSHWRVVDAIHATPFRWWLCPRRPARYAIEGDPSLLLQVMIGAKIIAL